MAQSTRISELSATISHHTATLDNHIRNCGLPSLSFDADGPTERQYTAEVEASRLAIEEATLELNELVKHPRALATDHPAKHAAKAVIAKFHIATLVPESGSISYGELSQKTGVDQGALECVLRLAISHRIFTEPKDGHLAHSPASRHLANEWAKKAGNAFADDFLPMHAYIAQALERYPQANEFSHAAAAVANGVDGKRSFYDMLNENPERADNFHSTMHLAQWLPGLSWDHLANGYDWASLPTSSTCVDVGGGHGQAAVAVSAKYPHLKWIVQDSAQGISGHPPVPDAANITYMEHDFLAPQPDATKGVDVFFMRWILHNWPDQYCRRILRALIPSMTPESRILIMETVMPRPGSVSNLWERNLRSLDVGQLALGNGRERDRSQWQSLLAGASGNGKFILQRVIEPPGSDLAILEVKWKDHS